MKTPEPIRILFVEDVSADVELAERALRKEDLHFVSMRVDTEENFLAALAEFNPDVVISDYAMPTFDGMRALKLALERDARRPFILFTGSLNEETAVNCIKAGATDYVLKERLVRLPFAVRDALAQCAIRLAKESAEQALRESEEKHRLIAEMTTDYIYAGELYPDGSTQTKWIIGAFQQITGYTVAEINALPNGFAALVHPDDLPEIIRHQDKLFARQSYTLEYRITTKTGAERWLRDYMRALPGETSSGAIRLLGAVQDVTARKHAEEALVESETKWRTLFESCPDGIALATPDGVVTDVNRAYLDQLGYSAQEFLGCHYQDITPSKWHEQEMENVAHILATGKPMYFEKEHIRKNGTLFPVALTGWAMRDRNGKISRLGVFTKDITERKRAEDMLRISEERYRLLVETANEGIWVMDENHQTTYVNQSMAAMLGYVPTEMLGKKVEEFFFAEDMPFHEERMKKRHAGKDEIYERRFRRRDGAELWTRASAKSLIDEEGHFAGSFAMFTDITERKHAEERNHQHLRELEAVNRVSTTLRAAQSLDTMLPHLIDETLEVIGAPAGLIALFDSNSRLLQSVIARGWLAQIDQTHLPETIAGRVFMMGDRYIASEFATDPHLPENVREHNLAGWGGASLPIRTADGIIGVLIVSTPLPRELTLSEIGLLESICEIAGNAIHRMLLHEQTHRQLRRLDGLRVIDNALTASLDLQVTLNVILDQVMMQLGVSATDVLLNSSGEHMLAYAAGRGFYSNAITRARVRLGEGLAGRVALERRLMHVPDLRHSHAELAVAQLNAGEQFVAYYAVPLIAKGQLRGVLEAFERTPIQHDREWFSFLQMLGEQAAIAIDNLELFSRLQRSNLELSLAYDTTLEGWSRTLDLRDKEEEGHNQRVAELTVRLARRLGMAETDLLDVRRGALLHDIGMMGIPEAILFKPGALDETEWTVMRRHPDWAHELLSPITYLHRATVIPYSHHERWDGRGYPRGLQGEAIPLPARIFAVVDAWDALTSDRAYRPAWSRERVLAHLREQSGGQFDPRVVEAFFKIIA